MTSPQQVVSEEFRNFELADTALDSTRRAAPRASTNSSKSRIRIALLLPGGSRAEPNTTQHNTKWSTQSVGQLHCRPSRVGRIVPKREISAMSSLHFRYECVSCRKEKEKNVN